MKPKIKECDVEMFFAIWFFSAAVASIIYVLWTGATVPTHIPEGKCLADYETWPQTILLWYAGGSLMVFGLLYTLAAIYVLFALLSSL